MKIACSKCGFESDGNFCTNCGAPLQQVEITEENKQIPFLVIPVNINEKKFGELSQSRSSIICTVVILFLVHLLSIIISVYSGTTYEYQAFLGTNYQIISAAIDIFLGINLLRGKNWARTWLLIRCVGGIVIFGAMFLIQGDLVSVIINTGVLLALIILITGVSTRTRLTGGIILAVAAILGGNLFGIITPSINLNETPETSIPTSFLTYTVEGFFSISYPPDWSTEISLIEEAEAFMKEYAKSENLEALANETNIVFIGSANTSYIYPPSVIVTVLPKTIWPLSSLVEADNKWFENSTDQYREYFRSKTTIGGRDAILHSFEYNDSGLMRFLSSYIAGDKFIWYVMCTCRSIYSDIYIDEFEDIIRSLRVEY